MNGTMRCLLLILELILGEKFTHIDLKYSIINYEVKIVGTRMILHIFV